MSILEYVSLFLISVAGSFHCVGMCGGIACIQAEWGATSRQKAIHWFLYHIGKISSYLFVGASFGALGALLIGAGRLLAFVAGSFMIWMAFRGLRRSVKNRLPSWIERSFLSIFRWIKGQRGFSASLLLGSLNGLLPCSLVYAFAAKAASTGSVFAGMLTMISFGLGTVPALFFSTKIVQLFSPAVRQRFASTGTFFIFILGVVTLLRLFSSSTHLGHR